ncbi:hypothetical protein V493_02943, partial [Pseudogymnoascus sp. VKM F-4281 (FW-2241)]
MALHAAKSPLICPSTPSEPGPGSSSRPVPSVAAATAAAAAAAHKQAAQFTLNSLDFSDLSPDPLEQFREWYKAAQSAGV